MVGYDKNADALTLGDDDSLKVGDYELKYSSANDRFEVEHPNGEVSDVPRSTSGSLVPEGFADVLSNGEVLADNGEIYTSVQTAVDNSTGFVFVGPGTFNENVTISTEGLTLEGVGRDTFIDGGTGAPAITFNGTDATARNLSVATTSGGGTNSNAFQFASGGNIENCRVRESDDKGISVPDDMTIVNTVFEQCDGIAVRGGSTVRNIVSGCVFQNVSSAVGFFGTSDSVIANNICVQGTSADSFIFGNGSNDNILIGNRVSDYANRGIDNNATDNIIANNRVSDSTNENIFDGGTGTVLDGNNTGASN